MKIEKITQSEIDMEKGLGFILGKIINKQNEIIDALQGEGEKCGVFRDHSEGIPCQNPKGNCPVHDKPTDAEIKHALKDAWCVIGDVEKSPQPVSTENTENELGKDKPVQSSTVEGWRKLIYKGRYSGKREGSEVTGDCLAPFMLVEDVQDLIAQVREEARGKYTGNINDDLNTFVVNYSKHPLYRPTDENDDMDDDSI